MLTKTPFGIILLTFIILMAVFFLGGRSAKTAGSLHFEESAVSADRLIELTRFADDDHICYVSFSGLSCFKK